MPNVFERYQNAEAAPSSFLLQRDGKPVGIGSVREIDYGMVRRMNGTEVLGKAADLATVYDYVAQVQTDKTLNQHLINFTINTNTLDRSNDIIEPAGIDLKKYERNNVLFWNHYTWGMPIGSGLSPTLLENKMTMDFNFHGLNDRSTMSETVGLLCLARVIKACSIGVIPLAWDDIDIDDNVRALYPTIYPSWSTKIRRYKKCEMIECSPCSIPMNPEAVQASFGAGSEEEIKALVAKGLFSADNPLFTILSRAVSRPPAVTTNPETTDKAGAKISSDRLEKLKQASQLLSDVIADAEGADDTGNTDTGTADAAKGISRKQYDRDMRTLITSVEKILTVMEQVTDDGETDPAILAKRKDDLRELLFGPPKQFMNDDEKAKSKDNKDPEPEPFSEEKQAQLLAQLNVQ
jgi:hypothetical protein